MAKSLAASMVAANRRANTAVQDDRVSVRFTDPPDEATDVRIEIVQEDPGRPVATFFGSIQGRQYKNRMTMGNAKVSPNHNRPHDMTLELEAGGSKFKAMMYDPTAFTLAHKLRVKVTGMVAGRRQSFTGAAPLHVLYKTAMIVPSGFAKDPGLNVVQAWARQWKSHDPSVRTIVPLPIIAPVRGAITPRHYDPLVAAMTKAAQAAPHGIVALAVGHGDAGGGGPAVPWCDLAAEDGKTPDGRYERGLLIIEPELEDGDPDPDPDPGAVRRVPGDNTKAKLDALDRCADVFSQHPIRVLLLHTCRAGGAPKFVQRFANRVRVFVRAHREQIEYTGATFGSVEASYADVRPRADAKTEWPTSEVSREFAPENPPPERFDP